MKLPRSVSEQLRFEERFRDARAVDGDHRPPAAVAALVNQLRQHFLAGATLASDQDLRVAWSRILRLFDHIHHYATET